MKKVSYDKFDEYASTFDPEFNLLEEKLARSHDMAFKLADLLNDKIDECEKLKEDVRWYVERVVELEKQSHNYEVECEALKEELAHFKYLYKVVSLHEEEA